MQDAGYPLREALSALEEAWAFVAEYDFEREAGFSARAVLGTLELVTEAIIRELDGLDTPPPSPLRLA